MAIRVEAIRVGGYPWLEVPPVAAIPVGTLVVATRAVAALTGARMLAVVTPSPTKSSSN